MHETLPAPIPQSQNPPTEIPAEGAGNLIIKKNRKRKPLIRRLLSNLSGRQTSILRQLTSKDIDRARSKELQRKLARVNHKREVISKLSESSERFENFYKRFQDVDAS